MGNTRQFRCSRKSRKTKKKTCHTRLLIKNMLHQLLKWIHRNIIHSSTAVNVFAFIVCICVAILLCIYDTGRRSSSWRRGFRPVLKNLLATGTHDADLGRNMDGCMVGRRVACKLPAIPAPIGYWQQHRRLCVVGYSTTQPVTAQHIELLHNTSSYSTTQPVTPQHSQLLHTTASYSTPQPVTPQHRHLSKYCLYLTLSFINYLLEICNFSVILTRFSYL